MEASNSMYTLEVILFYFILDGKIINSVWDIPNLENILYISYRPNFKGVDDIIS
jgi:hypothetical protein